MNRFIKRAFLFTLVCTGWNVVQAQFTEILSVQPRHIKINASAFSGVRVVDSRLDTANVGFIHKGGLNRQDIVTTTLPLKEELTASVNKLIADASKQDAVLCVNIRQFVLSEYWGVGGEHGVFRISAVFYLKQASNYRKLLTVNTRVNVKSTLGDVTKRLLDTIPEVWGRLVQQAAGYDSEHSDAATQLTARYPQDLDIAEKKAIPVYNVDLPQKGLYATFDDFKNNHPSLQVFFEQPDGADLPEVYELKEDGKKGKTIPFKKYYAVCDGKKIYISGVYALYPLTKNDNDFYFESIGREGGDQAPLEQNPHETPMGKDIFSSDFTKFQFKIDHVNGNFIPVRKVYK